ncbi:hypothetical protein FGB62_7g553 [Gracilaria domingensis]|nr:hypothetical protein FGB62_7g553 [Gracilaria domingensis]
MAKAVDATVLLVKPLGMLGPLAVKFRQPPGAQDPGSLNSSLVRAWCGPRPDPGTDQSHTHAEVPQAHYAKSPAHEPLPPVR